MAFNPAPRQLAVIKTAVFVLALLPFCRLVWGEVKLVTLR